MITAMRTSDQAYRLRHKLLGLDQMQVVLDQGPSQKIYSAPKPAGKNYLLLAKVNITYGAYIYRIEVTTATIPLTIIRTTSQHLGHSSNTIRATRVPIKLPEDLHPRRGVME